MSAVSPDCDTNKDRQIAGIERHVTVAKFGRDIDFHREPMCSPGPSNHVDLNLFADLALLEE